MKTLLGLIILALMLASCASKPEPTTCPAPPGELLVPPQPLAKLEKGQTQRKAVEAWIVDIEQYQVTRSRYARLQLWGVDQCAWPKPPGS